VVYFFIIAAILVFLWIVLSMIDDKFMPWTCPACYSASGRDEIGEYRTWYVSGRHGRIQCKACGARFKESPNGVLVDDRYP